MQGDWRYTLSRVELADRATPPAFLPAPTMADQLPKSAFELAMARLRQKDAEEGTVQRSLTDAQKAAIAEVNNDYEARLAQHEVMHKSAISSLQNPIEYVALEEKYWSERERLVAERDAKLEQLRQREAAE